MKKIWISVFLIILTLFIGANIYITHEHKENERYYLVEINRVVEDLKNDKLDLEKYDYIIDVKEVTSFEGGKYDYVIREIDGVYYEIDYNVSYDYVVDKFRATLNVCLTLCCLFSLLVIVYIDIRIMKPFMSIQNAPYELAKGNLSLGLKEEKNAYYGKFVWGLDVLREGLEEQKARELSLQKEKKTLILSISHDIKTPLSSIKLYTKALKKNLYNNEEKRQEIIDNISNKADEIEDYVLQIIKASKEDFLEIEVKNSEFYLDDLIKNISAYYTEKLILFHIDFNISNYSNCLLKGDIDRSVEICQNVIENAIKYGDGKYIKIDFAKEEDCLLLSIINSGCNLPSNELPHIFESFYRGSNVLKNKGSGLGLYICRQIIKKMDGDIFANINDNEMIVTVVFRYC